MGDWAHRPPQLGRRYLLRQKIVLQVDVVSRPFWAILLFHVPLFISNKSQASFSNIVFEYFFCCQIFQRLNYI